LPGRTNSMSSQETSLIKGTKILVAASGSIAAVKTPLLISRLVKAGAEIKTVITPSAAKLISPLSLSTLSRSVCYQDEDQWSKKQTKPLHISLAEWAEIIVVAPLTTSSLAKWAQGLGEGLLASILLAYEGPVITAAGMNTGMWRNPLVQNNWQTLQNNPKIICLNPSSGLLACDRIGEGRMADQELIELAITSTKTSIDLNGSIKKDYTGLNVLVTAGPTQEALDPARLITNRSSGRMGVLLAQAARFRGARVQLVHGPLSVPIAWTEGIESFQIETAEEMRNLLKKLQPNADLVVMAAAIADFRRRNGPRNSKLNKKAFLDSIDSCMEEVPDLLKELVKNKQKQQIFLGFSALTGPDIDIQRTAKLKRIHKGCDLLMANPIDRTNSGFGENENAGFLLGPNEMVKELKKTSKICLSHQLLDALIEIYRNISIKI